MHWLTSTGLDATQVIALAIAFVVLALLLVVARAWRRRRQRRRAAAAPPVTPSLPTAASATPAQVPSVPATPSATPAPPTAVPPTAVASAVVGAEPIAISLDEQELAQALQLRLGGGAEDTTHTTPSPAPEQVVWVEGGDEVLVHLDSLRVQLLDRILLASLDLEADQTGRQTLVVPFAFASEGGPGGLVAVTEAAPRGDAALVARWGHTVQEAIWACLLSLARDAAAAREQVPLAITAVPGSLRLRGGAPASQPVPQTVPQPVTRQAS